MKLLIIATLWPEPSSSAAGRRMLGLLELFVGQGWALTYACTAAESEFAYPLKSLGIQPVNIAVNDSSFDEFVKELSPDMVLYDRFMVEEQFSWRVEKQCPNAMTMLESCDLHCLRQARQQAVKENRPFTDSGLMNEVAFREVASIQRSDLTLVISQYEMDLLLSVFKLDASLIHYFPFIVDPGAAREIQSQWPSYAERTGFMCIGNFKHPPNWDSVQYLKQTIWPLIRRKLPTAEFYVYGAYPPPKAMQLNKPADGFYIKGLADNAKEVIQAAKVCLAPLRFGAGLKGKLLEAMEYGTPSVTSTIGAEGMHGKLPWNGTVVDDPGAFAAAAVLLHESQGNWQVSQQNGSEIIQQCFSSETFEPLLIEKIQVIKDELTAHRQNNFQGSLLKHHLMKSTKYMSLWIEEKNKRLD
jgi:glycosyltransferase involved in cell wall biosynthesis